jgi:hypothetical protein
MQGAHHYLHARLEHSGHPDVTNAAEHLDTLRRWRNTANYDLDRPFPEDRGVEAVNLCLDVVPILRDLQLEAATLARVVDAIRDYERSINDETWHAP